jgi:pimeloyl-[acyl-carrier protein] methyl ester esterase
MEGTGRLFAPFVAAAPPGFRLEVVPLPPEPLGYIDLATHLVETLRLTPDTILLGESFSGPLAIALAARTRVAGVILCNSFVQSPVPSLVRFLARTALFRVRPPVAVLRRWLIGWNAPHSLVDELRAAAAVTPPRVMAARVAAVCAVDATHDLARLESPLLYVRGVDDRLVPERSLATIARVAPNVVVRRVPGPHCLLQVAPGEAWAAIREFVAQLPRGE